MRAARGPYRLLDLAEIRVGGNIGKQPAEFAFMRGQDQPCLAFRKCFEKGIGIILEGCDAIRIEDQWSVLQRYHEIPRLFANPESGTKHEG